MSVIVMGLSASLMLWSPSNECVCDGIISVSDARESIKWEGAASIESWYSLETGFHLTAALSPLCWWNVDSATHTLAQRYIQWLNDTYIISAIHTLATRYIEWLSDIYLCSAQHALALRYIHWLSDTYIGSAILE